MIAKIIVLMGIWILCIPFISAINSISCVPDNSTEYKINIGFIKLFPVKVNSFSCEIDLKAEKFDPTNPDYFCEWREWGDELVWSCNYKYNLTFYLNTTTQIATTAYFWIEEKYTMLDICRDYPKWLKCTPHEEVYLDCVMNDGISTREWIESLVPNSSIDWDAAWRTDSMQELLKDYYDRGICI